MADDQIIKLLEEIRDLQRENAANYKQTLQNQQQAMQNQQQALAIQKGAVQRSKIGLIFVAVLFAFVGFTYLVPLLSWALSWAIRR
jgi:hypothetical protein